MAELHQEIMEDGALLIILWPVRVRMERDVEAGTPATSLRMEVVRL